MDTILKEHFGYLSDANKRLQYDRAIAGVIVPGSVVLDLGCGSGLLGLMALRAGADIVHFVDDTAILEVARGTVARLGWLERARFYRCNSFELELAERVDVVICDHVGYFGFDYGIPALLEDARQRFLKPGGVMVPARINLKLVGVSSENCHKTIANWQDGTVPSEFSWVSSLQANVKQGATLAPKELISEPVNLGSITLGAQLDTFVSWAAEIICSRDDEFHGVGGWFECELAKDIWMTNSPLADERLQRPQVFLGLEQPAMVKQGELVKVIVMARPGDHVIAWRIEFPDQGLRFAHSTWNALLLDRADLARAQPDRVASLSARGRARQIVLSYCDGKRTVAGVEAAVLQEHPELMPSRQALSAFVMQVLGRDASE